MFWSDSISVLGLFFSAVGVAVPRSELSCPGVDACGRSFAVHVPLRGQSGAELCVCGSLIRFSSSLKATFDRMNRDYREMHQYRVTAAVQGWTTKTHRVGLCKHLFSLQPHLSGTAAVIGASEKTKGFRPD